MNEFLKEKLLESYDEETTSLILDGLNSKKWTTFRINRLKTDFLSIKAHIEDLKIEYKTFKTFEDAFIINGDITESSIYKDGKIYLQSLSSMIPVYILNAKSGENILDMCAAPGSKTTFIQSLAKNKVNLTATELHKERFERLKYNINLQGANVYAININATQLDDNFKFDKILLDAPCSGSGTIDLKDNKYEKYFTKVLIDKSVKTQKSLIKKAYKLLRKGGELVYSTCSLLKEEDEKMIDYAKSVGFKISNCNFIDYVPSFDESEFSRGSVLSGENFIKIMPNSLYEGFFVAKFIKGN